MIALEKYRGTKTKHTCPNCRHKGAFSRYIGNDGSYISDEVGRCDRESKCGYHKKPREFFAENPDCSTRSTFFNKERMEHPKRSGTHGTRWNGVEQGGTPSEHFDVIPLEKLIGTLGNYERNSFVQFLLDLFPDCAAEIQEVLKMYFVGTFEDYTCFPSIDRKNRICRAKLIRFDAATGKRKKGDFDTSSLPAKLKFQDFKYKQLFFGEHLLSKCPNKPVAVVEAEKSAVIGALCFPEFVWLGSNNKSWLNAERLQQIDNRQIILYPDADGFDLWQEKAREARKLGAAVKVSSLIENSATSVEKAKGFDLADYLIEQQTEVNRLNFILDRVNQTFDFQDDLRAEFEWLEYDPSLKHDFLTRLDERIAILEIDGNLSRTDAERVAMAPAHIRQMVQNLF
jgi:hypothetical protein